MTLTILAPTLITDELDLLAEAVPLAGQDFLELGCGNAGA
jgi:hypothetical protein